MLFRSYCEKMDARHRKLMNVIYGLIITIIGAGVIQLVSFGEVRAQVASNTKIVNFVSSDYTPTWYMEGMSELFSIHTRQISAIVGKDKIEIESLNADFQRTVKIMQDNFIRMRGGMTNTTRSAKQAITGGSK